MGRLEVRHYMTAGPYVIGSDEPLEKAKQIMREQEIRHLPVLENGAPVGLLSARDIGFLERLPGVVGSVSVAQVIDRGLYTVGPDTALADAARAMADGKLGYAVVVQEGRVIGIFTVTDALRALADLAQHASGPVPGAPRIDLEILKLLVQVAWADGEVVEEEIEHILGMARKSQASERELAELERSLTREKRLPAPDFGLLRRDPEAAMRAVEELVAVDDFIVEDEDEVMQQIRELLRA
jgi:acetoin utilization protein AcuB